MLLLKQEIERFLSTNLDQPYPVWANGTEYQAKQTVVYENHIYRSIVNNNIGVTPDLNTGKWLLFGVDNAFASIDLRSHTKSIIDDGLEYIEYVFEAVGFTYLGFSQIQGSLLEIWEYDSAGVEVKHTNHPIGQERVNAISWYTYFYNPIPDHGNLGKGKPVDFLYRNINTTTAKIKIRVHKNTDNYASLSAMVGGKASDVGATQYGVEVGLIDYTEKETDKYGITTLKKRDAKETMVLNMKSPAKHSQLIKREVKEHLGMSLMFIADPSVDTLFENLIIFGYILDYKMYLNNGVTSESTMHIEEII